MVRFFEGAFVFLFRAAAAVKWEVACHWSNARIRRQKP